MSTQYKRVVQLTLDADSGSIDMSNMRIVFNITQQVTGSPNIGSFRIYNLSKDTENKITAKGEFSKVTLSAGYEYGEVGTIFVGEIKQTITGQETNQVDTFIDVFAADSDRAHTQGKMSRTFAAGSTPKDHLDEMVSQLGQYGVTLGYVGADLSKPKYTRAVTMDGMVSGFLRRLSLQADAQASIQNGQIQIVKTNGDSVPGGNIVLNSQTGLISRPQQTQDGILVRALINPQFAVNRILEINEASIQRAAYDMSGTNALDPASAPSNKFLVLSGVADGTYRIVVVNWTGDTRGQNFYADMVCIGAKTGHESDSLKHFIDQGHG